MVSWTAGVAGLVVVAEVLESLLCDLGKVAVRFELIDFEMIDSVSTVILLA